MKKTILYFLIIILSFILNSSINSTKITISAIGDIMAHYEQQIYALYQENNYLSLFQPTNKIFLNDDLTIANLETPICDELPISGYPEFNAKSTLLDAIKESGIEVLSISNNHTLDHGIKAVKSTILELKKRNFIFAGAGLTEKQGKDPFIFNVKGIIIGFYSATWASNKKQISSSHEDPYVYILPMNNEIMINDFCENIKKTKEKVDLLIVSYHSGQEYISTPIKEKENILKLFAESGADIVLSHHPHVLQKIEYYSTKDKRKTLIAYSLGNFISAQAKYIPVLNNNNKWIYDNVSTKTAEGIIMQFDVIKWDNNISITNTKIIPIFNICFPYYYENKKYIGYKTFFIDEILKIDQTKYLGYYDFNNSIKKLVSYRLNEIKKLINFPIITLD